MVRIRVLLGVLAALMLLGTGLQRTPPVSAAGWTPQIFITPPCQRGQGCQVSTVMAVGYVYMQFSGNEVTWYGGYTAITDYAYGQCQTDFCVVIAASYADPATTWWLLSAYVTGAWIGWAPVTNCYYGSIGVETQTTVAAADPMQRLQEFADMTHSGGEDATPQALRHRRTKEEMMAQPEVQKMIADTKAQHPGKSVDVLALQHSDNPPAGFPGGAPAGKVPNQ